MQGPSTTSFQTLLSSDRLSAKVHSTECRLPYVDRRGFDNLDSRSGKLPKKGQVQLHTLPYTHVYKRTGGCISQEAPPRNTT